MTGVQTCALPICRTALGYITFTGATRLDRVLVVNMNMSVEEHIYLSQARKILSRISGVFGTIHQQGSAMHQDVFREELVRHLDAAESSKCHWRI